MANIEDAPRLRELCEKASKEYDHNKLLDLVRQINDLLEKGRAKSSTINEQRPLTEEKKKASALWWRVVAANLIARTAKSGSSLIRGLHPLGPESETHSL